MSLFPMKRAVAKGDIKPRGPQMMEYLTFGATLGLSAGLAPGPLLTLVISETLHHGMKAGVKVALAPLVTDLPIILLTFFALVQFSHLHRVLGVFSLAGGVFLLFMGYQTMYHKDMDLNAPVGGSRSLAKGILANALNPHPYLFWFCVGAPTIGKALKTDPTGPFAFVCGFYVLLIGSKVLLALVVGRWTSFLQRNAYRYAMRLLGLALCALAILLFRDGVRLLGWS